jgi:pyruvate,water dikinase
MPWRQSQQIALTMIQALPKLTLERNAEIEAVARGSGCIEDCIARWGYAYLGRDELLDISTWKSWGEDPAPLQTAIMQAIPGSTANLAQRVLVAQAERDNVFVQIRAAIRDSEAIAGPKLAAVFEACVAAAQRHFPLKDDRDVVLSHVQAALRLVLLEAARRMRDAGILAQENDVFLFCATEVVECIASGSSHASHWRRMARDRQEEQRELARYRFSSTDPSPAAPRHGDAAFTGYPASPGVVEGPVRVLNTAEPIGARDLQTGEILWLKGEAKTGWTMFFGRIKGLVYENGNWLSHETNICRELRIPAVVGVKDPQRLMRTGRHIRIDGGVGTVQVSLATE